MMSSPYLRLALYLLFYLLPGLLLAGLLLIGLGLRTRRRVLTVTGIILVMVGMASGPAYFYQRGLDMDSAATLAWAYVNSYQYDPTRESPDPALLPIRPEVLIQRQFDALLGQTGPSPLRRDTPLVGYKLEGVWVTGWSRDYPKAEVSAQLSFADGRNQSARFDLTAGGGSVLVLPGLGETTWQIHGWRDSPLQKFFREPAPATPVSANPPPIGLETVASFEAGPLERGGESIGIAVPSDVAGDGRLLFDQEVHTEEGRYTRSQMMLRHSDGQLEELAQTFISARGKFSPDGRRVLYVRSRRGNAHHLVVRDADGKVTEIGTIDWMTHHWVDDDRVAYSFNGQVQLYSLADRARQRLAPLPPESLIRSRLFRVSPGGDYLAYSDTEGRLWLMTIDGGGAQPIGWDVHELSWGAGMAWDAAGKRLAYSAFNQTTLPDQAEVWVWDTETDRTTLLARSAPGFLEDSRVNFGKLCWADGEMVLFAAHRLNRRDVRLLAAAANGSGLWDVTPAGLTIPFPELTCANGYVAAPTDRTRLGLLKIVSLAPSSEAATASPILTPSPLATASSVSWFVSALPGLSEGRNRLSYHRQPALAGNRRWACPDLHC